MVKRIEILLLLLIVVNSYSQSTKSSLDDAYSKYKNLSNSENSTKLIDYLMKQYYLLVEIEESNLITLKSPSKEIETHRLELIAYNFFENKENFEKKYKERPLDLSEENLNQYVHIYGKIEENFGVFRRFLNRKDEEQKELYEEFESNNLNCIPLLIELLKKF